MIAALGLRASSLLAGHSPAGGPADRPASPRPTEATSATTPTTIVCGEITLIQLSATVAGVTAEDRAHLAGNTTTTPAQYLPADYRAPGFRLEHPDRSDRGSS